MTLPWQPATVFAPALSARIRQRAIFECCKWDPQVEDVCTLAPYPLVLRRGAWDELVCLAEELAAEAMAAETELAEKPSLHRELGFDGPVRRALRAAARTGVSRGAARLMRFDFHYTEEGWRISEVNSDVPGGINEAAGLSRLVASHVTGHVTVGDPARCLAEAIRATQGAGATVALVHATAYSDDRQVMVFLGRELEQRGLRPVLASPGHLRWHQGRAELASDWFRGAIDFVFRFFPAEWLPNLPRACGWKHFFAGGRTPLCNPATALLTQTKRFPLVWPRLKSALPTWARLLPETRDPREVAWCNHPDWVLKPACGRVGELIGLWGVTTERDWRIIWKNVRRWPERWVAQRRFDALPMTVGEDAVYPCVGVFTLDGRVAGAYGRAAHAPLIDHRAHEVVVLVEPNKPSPEPAAAESAHEPIGTF